ncbi:LETM1-like protein-domain-containing protein [Phlyctochytrium arcticum]|nr:LETM1-like protein-domain-containing protein [Phlyctochytrium arcticum]
MAAALSICGRGLLQRPLASRTLFSRHSQSAPFSFGARRAFLVVRTPLRTLPSVGICNLRRYESSTASPVPSTPAPKSVKPELEAAAAAGYSAEATVAVAKKPLSVKIKEELLHYWHGTKLLGVEINISSRLLVKLIRGQGLSRREVRQLKRTTSDLLRLVPFVIILLIPFMELALPLILKLFPNMLPSTFESKFQEVHIDVDRRPLCNVLFQEEKKRKLVEVRHEMARFLQDTLEDASVSGASTAAAAKEFSQFFNKVSKEILRIAKKLPDELTLNSLSRPQLARMAKYMNIQAFGTDTFLRHQIERRLKYLEDDDKVSTGSVIMQEGGVDKLSLPELQQVCLSRGIRTTGVSPAWMRDELKQWLDLHVNHSISSSLLILSRAFQVQELIPIDKDHALKGNVEALQATLASLPNQVVNEAQLHISEAEGSAKYKQRLEVLQEQEELIEDELEQEAAIAAAKKAEEEDAAAALKWLTKRIPAAKWNFTHFY